jgi:DNA-binding XRE family transcriptional regulator
MASDLLCRAGVALYGEHWHSSLAHDLGVPRRTVQRWAAGDARPPPTLCRNLARLVATRQDELGKLYRELVSR